MACESSSLLMDACRLFQWTVHHEAIINHQSPLTPVSQIANHQSWRTIITITITTITTITTTITITMTYQSHKHRSNTSECQWARRASSWQSDPAPSRERRKHHGSHGLDTRWELLGSYFPAAKAAEVVHFWALTFQNYRVSKQKIGNPSHWWLGNCAQIARTFFLSQLRRVGHYNWNVWI